MSVCISLLQNLVDTPQQLTLHWKVKTVVG